MIGVGVVGYGYWGPNLVRNFCELPDARVVAISDSKPEARAVARHRHPGTTIYENPKDLIADRAVDAVVIATPVSTHFEIALEALKAGKHVLVAKPLTADSNQALRLIDEAARVRRVLMVDHTFVYTGAVRKIKEQVDSGALGDVYYYDSVRVNLGLFQRDVNVIWDLAVHDLSIMDYVLAAKPRAISATGVSHIPDSKENTAYLTLFFDNHLIGHIHVNWLSPVKIRRTLIGASQKMMVYDDLEPSEKIKIYDRGVTVKGNGRDKYHMLMDYRAGDMFAPQIGIAEALLVEARHFLECIGGGGRPITDGEAGLRTIALLEAATKSMANRGQPVEL